MWVGYYHLAIAAERSLAKFQVAGLIGLTCRPAQNAAIQPGEKPENGGPATSAHGPLMLTVLGQPVTMANAPM
jgi:hypothetical protein